MGESKHGVAFPLVRHGQKLLSQALLRVLLDRLLDRLSDLAKKKKKGKKKKKKNEHLPPIGGDGRMESGTMVWRAWIWGIW